MLSDNDLIEMLKESYTMPYRTFVLYIVKNAKINVFVSQDRREKVMVI